MQDGSSHESSHDSGTPDGPLASRGFLSMLREYGKIVAITIGAALFLKFFIVEAYRIPSMSMEKTLEVGDFLLVNKLSYGLRSPRHIPFTSLSLPSFALRIFGSVHRGDVVVFEFPGFKNEIRPAERVNYIKRCVGIAGDTIVLRSGRVWVNGSEIAFPLNGRLPSRHAVNAWNRSAELFPDGVQWTDIDYGPLVVPKAGDLLRIDPVSAMPWRVFIEREGHTVSFTKDSVLIDSVPASTYRVERNYYFMLGDNRDNSLDSRFWGFVPDDHLIGEAEFVYWSWDPDAPIHSFAERFGTIRWKRIGTLIR